MNPHFKKLTRPILQRVKGFAARVRSGFYGRGRQIKTASVQVAISSIGTTLVVEGYTFRNLLHGGDGKLVLPLRYLLEAYRQQDPPVLPQLAVSIELIVAVKYILPPRDPQHKRAAQLIIIAFFYLLRVGEYTKPRKQTRTVQFRFNDVLF